MVGDGVQVDERLPWPLSDAQCAALAQGQVVSDEMAQWRAGAECVVWPHADGQLVWHRWLPRSAPATHRPPVVLFHGGSGSWTHWLHSIGPLLAAGHAVWALDLPGFGASDAPAGVTDADGMLPLLQAALQAQFGAQPVQLVGFSFGGMTAGMLAAAYPACVEQLVLVGAPGIGLTAKHPVRLKGWRHLASPRAQLACHVHNLQALMLHAPAKIDPDTLALHVANVQRDRLPRRRISSTDVLVRALEQVICPVTAIYGEHDALYPDTLDAVEAAMAAQARHWRGLHRIAQAGHWVQYEQPERFHAVLLPLLATGFD